MICDNKNIKVDMVKDWSCAGEWREDAIIKTRTAVYIKLFLHEPNGKHKKLELDTWLKKKETEKNYRILPNSNNKQKPEK